MKTLAFRFFVVIAALISLSLSTAAAARPGTSGTDIAANDNTRPGGQLRDGVLELSLVARHGLWYPDGPGTTGLPVEAFGEAGKPLEVPGPLVRVPVGTRVVATIRNDLGHGLDIRGLADPADASTAVVHVANGATRRVSFVLSRPGAFGYYGSDLGSPKNPGETVDQRVFRDAELTGAIVVEKPHAPKVDHVFVLGLYAPVKFLDGSPNFLDMLETINGRSFPATERLTYERGQTVRWAVYNGSSMTHPMHLHGFYFKLDKPNAYDEVTHAFHPGEAQMLTWTADRAGNWMYHCHISDHISPHPPLAELLTHKPAKDDLSQAAIAARFHHPNASMAGMVIAIHVTPRPGDQPPVAAAVARKLALTLEGHDVEKPPYPGLQQGSIQLADGDRTTSSSGSLGPAIVLTRGQPVAITVTNHMSEQSSMHWHGVALQDSYYDGGAGMGMGPGKGMGSMSMDAMRMSPAIDPGASFVARFSPPDAGTFMYHAHMDDGWQLASGLNGPLIVLPPGATFDPATDHVLMINESYEKAGSPFVAIGGSLDPGPITMAAGVTQRLRFGALTLGGQDLVISLVDANGHVEHRTPIAKDGRDLPAALRREAPATSAMTIGETRDFSFTPPHAGPFAIKVFDNSNNGMLVATQPIDVK